MEKFINIVFAGIAVTVVATVAMTTMAKADSTEWGVSSDFVSSQFEINAKCGHLYTNKPHDYDVCRKEIEKKWNVLGDKK